MARYQLKCRVAIFYLCDYIGEDTLKCISDWKENYITYITPALKIIEGATETYKLQGLGSPIHKPDEECKKEHIHLMFYGSISDEKWKEFVQHIKSKIPQVAFLPKFLDRNAIQDYALYLTHETKASKDKQQFTDKEKEVFDCATQL